MYVDKPLGVSAFPCELMPWPRAWAEGAGRVVAYAQHDKGGWRHGGGGKASAGS